MFKFLNHMAIVVHTKFFVRQLEKTLRSEFPENFCSLEMRNSILTAEYFHFLYSDIDLAVVLRNCDFAHVTEVRRVLVRFKKYYPPMGEVEIYSEEEWSRLKELKNDVRDIYHPARSIRKYFWMGAPDDDYQSPKRLRALKVLLRKLDIRGPAPYSAHVLRKLIDLVRRHVKEEVIEGENSYYHTYFTCPFLAPLDHTNSGHRLFPFELVALASLFPTDEAGHFANRLAIAQIHTNQPQVEALWTKLRDIDQLEIKGSQRGRI